MNPIILNVWHSDASSNQTGNLRRLFDAEYLSDFGEWAPDAPYSYSPAELHNLAVSTEGQVVGHVGTQCRLIRVGNREVTVAGTGGVLIAPELQGTGVGKRVLAAAHHASRTSAPAEYGYLGCRKEVVPFYLAGGYTRIRVIERCLARRDQVTVIVSTDEPVLICAGIKDVGTWPPGMVDLRGTPW